jgi:chaperone required for assembly of F1-ATPase
MKRFWDQVSVVAQDGCFAVLLDAKPMRLPGGARLRLESRLLANAIAAEWQQAGGAIGGDLRAEDLPLTRLAGTAQERVATDPAPTIEALAKYAETDLLCYRASSPAALASRQAALWQPWLDWASRRYYGAHLRVADGVMPIAQPPEAIAALRRAVQAYPPFVLAGLGQLVPATGSLVLGLAVADGEMSGATAHDLAVLDDVFQAEQWGQDKEAAQRRRAVAEDIGVAAHFIALSR